MRNFITIFLLIAGAVAAFAQTKVEARLDSTTILIGEQTHLTVSVTAHQGAKVVFPTYRSQQLLNSDLEVVGSRQDTLEMEDGRQTIAHTYTLTGWNSRKTTVPSLNVKVDGKNYPTKSIPLTVDSLRAYTGKQAQMRPADDIMDNPFSLGEVLPYFWLSVLAVLLACLAFYLHLRLRDNKPLAVLAKVRKRKLPHERALDDIRLIRRRAEEGQDGEKIYYTQLTDVLRQYLEDRFGFNAKEMTSAEILAQLKQEANRDKLQELREVFQTADLVKFAKYSTRENEKTLYLTHVVQFIEDTKIEAVPELKSEEDETVKTVQRNRRSRMLLRLLIGVLIVVIVALLTYIALSIYELMN